jgi:Cd2+/Zn2+-exporting ATPase
MTKKQKKMLCRILIAAVLLIVVKLLPAIGLPFPIPWLTANGAGEGTYVLSPWPLYLIPYLIIGWDVLWRAIRNIANGQVFDENFLMALATVGAFGTGEYSESTGITPMGVCGVLFRSAGT